MRTWKVSLFAFLAVASFAAFRFVQADPPTPITDCGEITVSGAYAVANDISASGDCIVVSANDVSIDGGGFTITGDNEAGDDGIVAASVTGLSIQNVTIVNSGTGISLTGVPGATISNVTVTTPVQYGIFLEDSDNSSISGSTLGSAHNYSENTGHGIHVIDSANIEITDNVLDENDQGGIAMYGEIDGASITGNDITNTYYPIWLSGCQYSDFDVCENKATGIAVEENDLTNAWNAGIVLSNIEGSFVRTNLVSGADYAVQLYAASSNQITGNTIDGNGVGIDLDNGSEDNTVSTNTITNGDTGVYIEGESHGNTISENEIDDVVSGFFIDGSDNNQVLDNVITLSQVNYGSGSSSPLLFTWDGEGYEYVADVGRGIPRNVVGTDYVPVPSDALVPKDGKYSVNISQEYNEIVYYDTLKLMTFDHAPGYDVVTSLQRNKEGQFFTIADEPSNPMQSCTDMYGNDCLEDMQASDDKWSYKDESNLNSWIMDFGDLSEADRIQLVIQAARDYSIDSASLRTIQVKNPSGQWVDAYAGSSISSPGGSPRTQVIDLTGKFLTDDYRVKFGYDRTRVNYVAIDTSAPVSYTVNSYEPETADLQFHGYTAINKEFFWDHDWDNVSPVPEEQFAPQVGNFTKYGDVAPLLESTDDQFVIMHHGDNMAIEFPYVAPAGGAERSFIMDNWATFKHAKMGTIGQTVDPLPFNGMTAYPYPEGEQYPQTSENLEYIKLWNTRTVHDDRFGMALPDSVNTTVRGNTITNDSGDPEDPFIGDKGIYVYDETDSTIEDNTISGFYNGIVVEDSEGITLTENTLFDIQHDAIQAYYVTGLTITDNTITNTIDGGDGMEIENSGEIVITGNVLTDITDDGMYFANSQNITITDNTIDGVSDDGFDMEDSGSYTITGNTVTGVEDQGFEIDGNYSDGEDDGCETLESHGCLYNNLRNVNGINVVSGTSGGWVDQEVDLSPYVGSEVSVELAFATDGSVLGEGISLDDIAITVDGSPVIQDDVEGGENGWSASDTYGPSWSIQDVDEAAYSGEYVWYSGYADGQYTSLSRTIDLSTATSGSLTYKVNYGTENCCDYFGVLVTPIADDSGGGGEDDGDEKVVDDNDITSIMQSVSIDDATNISFLGNIFRSDYWVDNDSELNLFSDEDSGNAYYKADGTPAWELFDITDSDDNGYADQGTDLPFSELTLGTDLWSGLGMDEHPATEESTEPEEEPETPRRARVVGGTASAVAAAKASLAADTADTRQDSRQCPAGQILTQNLRAPSRNGRYSAYTKAIVTEAAILQAHLNRLGFNSGPVDGIIGPLTSGAIKRMQVFLGTMADGFVGPITRGLLNTSCGADGLTKT